MEFHYNKLMDGAVMVGAETIRFGIRPTLLAIIKQIGVLLYHISNKKTEEEYEGYTFDRLLEIHYWRFE